MNSNARRDNERRSAALIARVASQMNAACFELAMEWRDFQDAANWRDFSIDARNCECPFEIAAKAMHLLPQIGNPQLLEVICTGVWGFLVLERKEPTSGIDMFDAILELERAAIDGIAEAVFRQIFERWWA